jgi:hypothetical protein
LYCGGRQRDVLCHSFDGLNWFRQPLIIIVFRERRCPFKKIIANINERLFSCETGVQVLYLVDSS